MSQPMHADMFLQESYHKQIARQHACHKTFWSGQGAWSTLHKISYYDAKFGWPVVWAYVGGPKNLGR